MGCLATLYEVDFRSTGKIDSSEQALRLWKEILGASSEKHPDYIHWIQKPASTCWLKYLKTKRTEDLDQCILLGKASLDKTPDDDSQRAVRLSELASAYARRFDILGAMADLNQAIQLCEESLEKATQHEDPRLRDIVIDELVGLFKDRLERTKSDSDLDRLLSHVQRSLDQTPDGHSSRASLLYTMASAYYYRFMNTKKLVDSEQSILYHNKALEAVPEDPDDIADYLHSLSNVYEERFWVTDSPSDIQQAIELSKQALDRIPEDHLERTDYLTALADLYALVRKGNVVNLDEAIELYQQALEITQEAEGEAYLLSCLGLAHWNRFNESSNPADFQQSTHFYHRLLDFPTSHVKNRIQAGIYLLDQYATAKRWSQAYEAACQALSLFPLLTPHFLQTSDKQNVLVSGGTHNLGSDAAAAALMAGKEASEAIQLLELGRGIIASSQYDMRSDVSDLQRQHPEVAREYLELRDQLDVGEKDEEDSDTSDALDGPNERYDASKKLQEKIKEIRDIPGFDDFLSAPSESELLAAGKRGAIAVINVSKYRCDAFLIHNNEFRLVPLPHLEIIGLGDRITALSSFEPHTEVLEWLWDTIAEPVLKELGFTTKPQTGRWPRLWWIPTGPLTSFPLHAAGYHDRGSDTVLDRVISSYSTSIKALCQSLRTPKQTFTANHADQAVLVSMANTPGQAYLPYVSQEMDNLSSLCDSMSLETIMPQPLLSDVLGALKSCKLFHFAGHGRTHASDPSKSALLLRDDELTVANLFEINLHQRKPFLAYLSACGTGRVLDGKLLNEAIHLTAAFQLAGFQHVIGTLWNVNDDASVKMATLVYKWMKDQGISDESVSEGLHYASRELRNQWIQEGTEMRGTLRNPMFSSGQQAPVEASRSSDSVQRDARDVMGFGDAPLYWIPFVHFGI
jgi:CHAT domain-containing protein/tetratricopeptide (TPR) repeat protein